MAKINKRKWGNRSIRLTVLHREEALEIMSSHDLGNYRFVVCFQKFPKEDSVEHYMELYGLGNTVKEAVTDLRKSMYLKKKISNFKHWSDNDPTAVTKRDRDIPRT